MSQLSSITVLFESTLTLKLKATVVHVNNTKEFQECMNSCEVGNGVHSFDTIALAIALYEWSCNV